MRRCRIFGGPPLLRRGSVVGCVSMEPWVAPLPLPRVPSNLQSIDRHTAGAFALLQAECWLAYALALIDSL